ncbi:hypothetical protein [Streptomyces spectabilis]|uniref:Type IV secretory pathway VirB10-like protein n=1 Tax=Streptomyces spectabilis TaxID=68270 RepID=A0A7W8B3E5_STRST|nr:hypothetical protein [Streptomyces spectabilis]MBB5108425.1 type IV secretory pathway VirB10-like protein [Streptomyces spectabilis]GGV46444.1 hypothetical protein GCM10010245_72890 [Streptomyces spectabilis]
MTTTMTLLVSLSISVTVSAVSGCVGVDRTAAHGTTADRGKAPSGPTERSPRTKDRPPPRATQPPARDRLQRADPPPAPPRRTPRPAPPAPAAPAPAPRAATPDEAPVAARPRPQKPRPEGPRHGQRPRETPHGPPPRARDETGVCALARKHGHWDPDSPQAVICREVYGS